MAHVFLSYSHKDHAYAARLKVSFEERGIEVWMDDEIDYGDQYPKVIEAHLDACLAVVLIMSENSKDSEWVANELEYAKTRSKPILPLLLSGDKWLSLATTQHADVVGRKLPPEDFYRRLTQELGITSRLGAARGSAPGGPAPRSVLPAATAMSLFVAAGFWLTPARPGWLLGEGSSTWTATALFWLGVLIMAPGVVLGPHLAQMAAPRRVAVRALGAAIVVGTVLLFGLVLFEFSIDGLLDVSDERLRLGFRSLVMVTAIWVGATMALPMRHSGERLWRLGVLAGAVVGPVMFWGAAGQKGLDYFAWAFAALIPVGLVLADYAAPSGRDKG